MGGGDGLHLLFQRFAETPSESSAPKGDAGELRS
ncbi:hypothetical protein BOS5A_130098 [Bosea sp. EC-HK365B]|nr:hypothetical protein BOS5A_130098 [Bosea sp. EC-HK365B]